jgi:hypothetical protein
MGQLQASMAVAFMDHSGSGVGAAPMRASEERPRIPNLKLREEKDMRVAS